MTPADPSKPPPREPSRAAKLRARFFLLALGLLVLAYLAAMLVR